MTQHTDQPATPETASLPDFPQDINVTAAPSLAFDADAFVSFLDDEDWTIEQKCAYAQALWPVVAALLDWNFRLDATREAIDAAKQLERAAPK